LQEKQVSGEAVFLLALLFRLLLSGGAIRKLVDPLSPSFCRWYLPLWGRLPPYGSPTLTTTSTPKSGLSCCSGWREESHLDRRVAKKQHDAGLSVYDATIAGAKQRFRPVLMTALAFIVRVFPLVVATGVGAGSRRALGTPVWGGW
jgi:hypothetical protein